MPSTEMQYYDLNSCHDAVLWLRESLYTIETI